MGETMKAVVYDADEQIRYKDVPKRKASPGRALVKVEYCGICGCDVKMMHKEYRRAEPGVIMGHEISGVIEEIEDGTGFSAGDRVTVVPNTPRPRGYNGTDGPDPMRLCMGVGLDGGFCEYADVPVESLVHVPEGLPMKSAALAEPASVGLHAVNRGRVMIGDKVAVIGIGAVGLMAAECAREISHRNVIIIEQGKERIALAKEMGFEVIDSGSEDVIQRVMELTDGVGVNVLLDAAGVEASSLWYTKLVMVRGRIVTIAMPDVPLPVDINEIAFFEREIIGAAGLAKFEMEMVLQLMAEGRIDADRVITHVYKLEEYKEALEVQSDPAKSLKVLLEVNAGK